MSKRTFDVEIRVDSDGMEELEKYDGGIKEYLVDMIGEEDFELISAGEGTEKEGYLFVSAVISLDCDDSVDDIHEAVDDYLSADCKVVSIRERQ